MIKSNKPFMIVFITSLLILCLLIFVYSQCSSKPDISKNNAYLNVNKIEMQHEGDLNIYTITDTNLINEIISILDTIKLEKKLSDDTNGYIFILVLYTDEENVKYILHQEMSRIDDVTYSSENSSIIKKLEDFYNDIKY